MKIHEKEELLFGEWELSVPGLVKDGIVSENEYNKAKYKIVYILKEVNGGKNWDLRDFLSDEKGGRPDTWDNISRWTKGILNIEKEIEWNDLKKDNEKRRIDYLKKICAMNLKKTSGKDTSNKHEIELASKRDSDFLKRQYELYQPDITVCCGTASDFFDTIYSDNKREWLQTSRGINYEKDNGRIIIDYAHPASRTKPCLLYYGLMDAVREILSIKL